MAAYSAMDRPARDAMTAALSRLLSRMESMRAHARARDLDREHMAALAHLRGAWHLDHFLRDLTGHGIAVGTTSLDAAMAESVLRILEDGGPDTRIVVAAFTTGAPLTVADLHAARPMVDDASSFQRMRMEGYFTEAPIFGSFDAIAYLPRTGVTEYVTGT